jgi:transposase-like protein
MTDLTDLIYTNEAAAREHLENLRWPDGPICPFCGVVEQSTKLEGKSHRAGLYKCRACRKPYTVTVGTVFERSKIALNKWVLATHLLSASKKGMSSHQLHRMLGVTYKTAWFMAHRIREAMREISPDPLGGPGKIVEADEAYISKKPTKTVFVTGKGWVRVRDSQAIRGRRAVEKVFALVERDGKARSFHVEEVTAKTLRPILVSQIDRKSRLMTDEARLYRATGREFAEHQSVNHSIHEYVRGEASTNTIEGYFSILKRGLIGTYQHVGSQHLKRYLGEFDFRYNHRKITDAERSNEALKGIEGKRVTYRRVNKVA